VGEVVPPEKVVAPPGELVSPVKPAAVWGEAAAYSRKEVVLRGPPEIGRWPMGTGSEEETGSGGNPDQTQQSGGSAYTSRVEEFGLVPGCRTG